jgi:CRISPR-associated protein Csx10
MNGLLFTLTLEEPVLANSLGGEPNSAHSLFYVPGGLVRGAAIHAYRKEKRAEDKDFRRLFLNGSTRYLNAYPLVDGRRASPAPLTWQIKHRRGPDEAKIIYAGFRDDIETRGVSFDFCLLDGDNVNEVKEEWQVNVHTQRDAERGRSTANAGAVYRYIAMPAGMQLQGAILTEDQSDAATIRNLFGKTILLGKARTAGYGSARIEFEDLPANWEKGSWLIPDTTSQFSLTLLSPALVRDETGQFTLDITPALEARLGKIKSIQTFRKEEIVGGFNRTWGLPLPQISAIAAGSVFEFETESEIGADVLHRLEETGIGERRAEGFGRVAVNHSFPEKMEWHEARIELSAPGAGALPENDSTAHLMLRRLLRRDLDEAIIVFARKATADYKKDGVPNSQLSRWQVILRDALGKKDDRKDARSPLVRIQEFCSGCQGKTGWEKMTKTRIKIGDEKPRLTSWIEDLLQDNKTLVEALGAESQKERGLGSVSVKSEDFNVEYRLRLLDAVFAIMAKKNSEGGKNG